MKIRPMHRQEKQAVKKLLISNALPVQDFDTAEIDLLVAVIDATIIGTAGLEQFGQTGLLRSLAVDKNNQMTGIGAALIEAIEQRAQQKHIKQLVLLTETAAPFFAKHGYRSIARTDAPDEVKQSGEFHWMCPASAVCMHKSVHK